MGRTNDVRSIAQQLGETSPFVLGRLGRVVQALGTERSYGYVAQAQAVYAAGGLLRPNGESRTLGGVFFRLLRDTLPEEERQQIFMKEKQRKRVVVTMTAEELHTHLAQALELTAAEDLAQLTRLIALAGVQRAHDALARAGRGDPKLPSAERYRVALRQLTQVKEAVWMEAVTGEAQPPKPPKHARMPESRATVKAPRKATKASKGAAAPRVAEAAPPTSVPAPQHDAQLDGLAQLVATKLQTPDAMGAIREAVGRAGAPAGVAALRHVSVRSAATPDAALRAWLQALESTAVVC